MRHRKDSGGLLMIIIPGELIANISPGTGLTELVKSVVVRLPAPFSVEKLQTEREMEDGFYP